MYLLIVNPLWCGNVASIQLQTMLMIHVFERKPLCLASGNYLEHMPMTIWFCKFFHEV